MDNKRKENKKWREREEEEVVMVRKETIFFGKHLVGAAVLCLLLVPFIIYPWLWENGADVSIEADVCSIEGTSNDEKYGASDFIMRKDESPNYEKQRYFSKDASIIVIDADDGKTKKSLRKLIHQIVVIPVKQVTKGLKRLTKKSVQVIVYPITPFIAAIRAVQTLLEYIYEKKMLQQDD